jgi:hypothetical protein
LLALSHECPLLLPHMLFELLILGFKDSNNISMLLLLLLLAGITIRDTAAQLMPNVMEGILQLLFVLLQGAALGKALLNLLLHVLNLLLVLSRKCGDSAVMVHMSSGNDLVSLDQPPFGVEVVLSNHRFEFLIPGYGIGVHDYMLLPLL